VNRYNSFFGIGRNGIFMLLTGVFAALIAGCPMVVQQQIVPVLQSIAITEHPVKNHYTSGEALDLTGLEVTGTYSDGSTRMETVGRTNVSGYNPLKEGDQTLTVTVIDKTATFGIYVKAGAAAAAAAGTGDGDTGRAAGSMETLQSIAVTALPGKTAYTGGEELDLSGLEVTGTYSDGSTGVEPVGAANISGYNPFFEGAQTVTVTINGRTASFAVVVLPAAASLTGIAVTVPPAKTAYAWGEELDISGLVVTFTYSTGAAVSGTVSLSNISGYNPTIPGPQILTVSIGGRTAVFNVAVREGGVVLQSIAVTTRPAKIFYIKGEELALGGLVVTGTYSVGAKQVIPVTAANVTGYDANILGPQILTVTIDGKTATFTVTVNPAALQSIAVTRAPDKIIYLPGEALDLSGLVVTGTYTDGTTKTETVTAANVTGYKAAVIGAQTLTVTLSGKTASFMAAVTAAALQSIAVTSQPTKTIYWTGETLNISGLVVTGTYENGTSQPVSVSLANISGAGLDSEKRLTTGGEQTLTVTINDKSADFMVGVNALLLINIGITRPPYKTSYVQGDTLDLSGLVVTGIYSDGTSRAETVTAANVAGYNAAAIGTQTLTVTVNGKTAAFKVTVNAPVLQTIAVSTLPAKTAYWTGEDLDISGLAVTGTYTDGTTRAETVTADNVIGYDPAAPGTQTLIVAINGTAAAFTVTVSIPSLQTLAVTSQPTKTTYFAGDTLDISGLVVAGFYADGTTKTETVIAANVTGPGLSAGKKLTSTGQQSLTITINGTTTFFIVTVNPVVLQSIAVTSQPTRTVYFAGDTLDLSGLEVTGSYSNGTIRVETVTADNVTGYNDTDPGVQTLTVTISGMTAAFEVTISTMVPQSIAITKEPAKTTYVQGEELDLSGLEVTVTYTGGTNGVISVTAANITGYNANTLGAQTLTVTINGKTAAFEVTVNAPLLQTIAVTKAPAKNAYFTGEELDLSGLVVTGTYENGTTRVETVTADNVTGYDANTTGTQTLTVTIDGKTASFTVTVSDPVLQSIAVSTQPTKTIYVQGEALNISGLVVTGTYTDGTTKAVPVTADNVSGYDAAVTGQQTLTVTIDGKTATFTVTVSVPVLQSIVVSTLPAKTAYWTGEELDLSGLVVTGAYSNGGQKTETVGAANVSGYDAAVTGTQTVTITINNKTAVFLVTGTATALLSIAVTKEPTKTSYWTGDALDLSGLVVTGTYENGTTKAVPVTVADNVTGYDTAAAGTQTLTVTVGGKTATFTVTVSVPVLQSIAVTSQPTKTAYFTGEELDLSGLVVTGTYSSGAAKVETVGAANVSGYDAAVTGPQTLTVTINGKTATFTVTVTPSVLQSIAVTSQPTKTTYWTGDTLDISGLGVTGAYSDGTAKAETVNAANITGPGLSGDKKLTTAGPQTLTVTINGKTATFTVTVSVPVLQSIAVSTLPAKTTYVQGEPLNISGLGVTGTYSNGAAKAETVTADNVSGYNAAVTGTQTLTVTVGGKTATFTVTVNPPALQSIAVTSQPTKTTYWTGDALDISGLVVTGTYENGTAKTETVIVANVTGPGLSGDKKLTNAGQQTLTITINGKTVTFTVTVNAPALQSIAVTSQPTKTTYYQGDAMDLNGLVVTGAYENGTTKTETVTAANVTGYNAAAVGTQTLTVTIDGKTVTFTVTVNAVVLQSIAVTKMPTKTTYYQGDALDLNGLVVTGTYSNGTAKAETVTADNVTGPGLSGDKKLTNLGQQTLTVTVGDKTVTFTVTVNAVVLQSIAVTKAPTKTVYVQGETLNISGLVVTGTYSNGTTSAETVNPANVTGYNANTLGAQTLTVTINGETATFTVKVQTNAPFSVNLDDSINVAIPGGNILSKSGNGAQTFVALTIEGTYADYKWLFNESDSPVSQAKTYTLRAEDCRLGTNYLTAQVRTTGGVYYTREITFTVIQ
jgi:hypothetical protein